VLASALRDIVREDLLDDASDADAGYDSDARWSDTFLLRQIGEAQRQACYRKDLRHLYDTETSAICSIAVVAGTQSYALDRRILRLHEVRLGDRVLAHTSRARLDEVGHGWRSTALTRTPDSFFVTARTLTLDAMPAVAGTLALSVWREPLADPAATDALEWLDEPEMLGHWVAHRAFMIPDEDLYDPERAAMHLALFNQTFGEPIAARERLDILGAPEDLWLHPRTPFAQPLIRKQTFDIET
jgi:hypothetical protein